MGMVGNGMKKKKIIESENWKQMGEAGIEYFKKIEETRDRIYDKINDLLPE